MRSILTVTIFLLSSLSVSAAEPTHHDPLPNLTILADEALMLPLSRLSRDYALSTYTPLTIIAQNNDHVEQQIEQGIEAHIIISANTDLMNRLSDQGMTDVSSRKEIARTQLALIGTNAAKRQYKLVERISLAAMLQATGDTPIFIDEKAHVESPLVSVDLAENINARTIIRPNAEEVITAIRDDEGLGIVMATNTVNETDIKILALIADEVSRPITFESAVLASELMEPSNKFVDYLQSRRAKKILAQFGFQTSGK